MIARRLSTTEFARAYGVYFDAVRHDHQHIAVMSHGRAGVVLLPEADYRTLLSMTGLARRHDFGSPENTDEKGQE